VKAPAKGANPEKAREVATNAEVDVESALSALSAVSAAKELSLVAIATTSQTTKHATPSLSLKAVVTTTPRPAVLVLSVVLARPGMIMQIVPTRPQQPKTLPPCPQDTRVQRAKSPKEMNVATLAEKEVQDAQTDRSEVNVVTKETAPHAQNPTTLPRPLQAKRPMR
jgi:hypothetical protein